MRYLKGFLLALMVSGWCISGPVSADTGAAKGETANPAATTLVNINTANAETLALVLDGVGAVRAQSIINYRERHGLFESIDELEQIKGVGPVIVEQNGDKIQL